MIAPIIRGGKEKGLKNCYELKLHNLDIDGDICHHIHNTVKQFCKPFECFVEKWIDDIHWDTKYSTDILDSLKEICFILNVPFRKPPQRVSHRWLSIFNCFSINMTLIDPLILLNYAWIPNDFPETYEGDIKTIFDKYELNEKAKAIINAIQTKMKQKKLTDEGKGRKGRIVTKLFYEKSTLLSNSNLFMSVLLLLKSSILTFEQKEPLTHRLHRSLVENFRAFLGCFMKFEVINNTSNNKLNLIDVASNVRKLKTLYVGDENEKLVSSLRKNKIQRDIATDFYRKLRTTYFTAVVYIQKKYALNNPLLKLFCALDPRVRQSSLTHENLLNLKPYFETF